MSKRTYKEAVELAVNWWVESINIKENGLRYKGCWTLSHILNL